MERLGKKDKQIVDSFIDGLGKLHAERHGHKLHTDGVELDGAWMGGNGLAYWEGGKIHFPDKGSRSAQFVQNYIRRKTPASYLPHHSRPTMLDTILDKVQAGKHEVTLDTEGYTRAQVEKVISAAKARGLHAAYSGRHILVRDLRGASR